MKWLNSPLFSAIAGALAGAIAGGFIAYFINENNLRASNESQNLELSRLMEQWGKENSRAEAKLRLFEGEFNRLAGRWEEEMLKKDSQLRLMEEGIQEMKKSYAFSQEKHVAEIRSMYDLIGSNSANTRALVEQQEKIAKDERERYQVERNIKEKNDRAKLMSDLIGAAELFRAAQIGLARTGCVVIDNTKIISNNGSTTWLPNTSADCSGRSIAEREFYSARAKFNVAVYEASKIASDGEKKAIVNLKLVLDASQDKLDSVSDTDFRVAVWAVREFLK